ncbi:MAG TPA: hypothetical protein VFQ76_11760 [Longimicrobiaceae bacterium]|nr:hypothetical protein [Longimicrobiaceae bacterium]
MATSTTEGEGEFILHIDITGICMYLWAGDRKSVTLFMPDAALRIGGPSKHPDGTRAVPHAGYLRFDLKNLDTQVEYREGELPDDLPSYEVVHRFQHEELVLSLPEGDEITGALQLPDTREFAPVLRAKPEINDDPPPPSVLMRTQLAGGDFFTREESILWKIDGDLREDKKQSTLSLGGEVAWERRLSGKGLDVVLSRFDGTGTVRIPLVARAEAEEATPVIRLKLANLCENPLEWPELDTPLQPVPDVDFKWVYQLLERRPEYDPGEFPAHLCPVPEPILKPVMNQGDLQDCFGVQVTGG